MQARTEIIENFHYVPEAGWTRGAFTVLRAGKLAAAGDYRIERTRHAGQDVLFCVAGRGTVRTQGAELALEAGGLAWIANEEFHAHAADARDPWTLLWFRFDGPDPAALRRRLVGPLPARVAIAGGGPLPAWFERLFAAMRERGIGLDWRLNQLVGEFFLILDRAVAEPTDQGVPPALTRAMTAMRADLGSGWSGEALAALAGLGPSQLRRLFAKHLRTSPRRWLLRERLIQAQAMIQGGSAPLAEIADACGFCDVYHFSREFKRSVGLSPAAWRRNELGRGARAPSRRRTAAGG